MPDNMPNREWLERMGREEDKCPSVSVGNQNEMPSAEQILLVALELAAPHLCGAKCPSVKYDDQPWTHCDECRRVTAAIELGRSLTA